MIWDIIISALLVIGGFFGLVGSYGLVKLPDPMTRLHAPTKAATLGVGAVLLGAVIGVMVTFTSVGAGAIGVTVLLLVFPHLPLPRIIAADIAYAVPLTLVAGLGHASLGSVDWPLLGLLLTGSLPGIWLGSRLVSHTPERLIRSILSALLAWAGAKLVLL